MYRIAVCEDEANVREQLCSCCNDILNEDMIEHKIMPFSSAEEFESEADDFDLVMLDIDLGGKSGLDMARDLRRAGSRISIIFVTGHEEYLRYGYSVQPVHFLLKPISKAELSEAIAADIRINHSNDSVVLYSGTKTVILPIEKFIYGESYNHNVLVHTTDGNHFFRTSLIDIERRMDSKAVCRCHNSYIVNMRYIKELTRSGIILTTGQKLPVRKEVLQ